MLVMLEREFSCHSPYCPFAFLCSEVGIAVVILSVLKMQNKQHRLLLWRGEKKVTALPLVHYSVSSLYWCDLKVLLCARCLVSPGLTKLLQVLHHQVSPFSFPYGNWCEYLCRDNITRQQSPSIHLL